MVHLKSQPALCRSGVVRGSGPRGRAGNRRCRPRRQAPSPAWRPAHAAPGTSARTSSDSCRSSSDAMSASRSASGSGGDRSPLQCERGGRRLRLGLRFDLRQPARSAAPSVKHSRRCGTGPATRSRIGRRIARGAAARPRTCRHPSRVPPDQGRCRTHRSARGPTAFTGCDEQTCRPHPAAADSSGQGGARRRAAARVVIVVVGAGKAPARAAAAQHKSSHDASKRAHECPPHARAQRNFCSLPASGRR